MPLTEIYSGLFYYKTSVDNGSSVVSEEVPPGELWELSNFKIARSSGDYEITAITLVDKGIFYVFETVAAAPTYYESGQLGHALRLKAGQKVGALVGTGTTPGNWSIQLWGRKFTSTP